MNNFIQLLKSLKTPAKYLLYFFIAYALFNFFFTPPHDLRDEIIKRIGLTNSKTQSTPLKLNASKEPESIKLHMDYFSQCTKDKVNVNESEFLVVYSLQASLSCLLSPLSKTEPRFKAEGAVKSSYGDSDILVSPEFIGLDSLNETVFHYGSLFDGNTHPESFAIEPKAEALIKLKDDRVIVFTAPGADGVSKIEKISNKYLIAYVAGGGRWVAPYLISADLKEITTLSSGGSIEVVDLENLVFKAKGMKSYWEKGGAFWFDAIIDKNGEIIKIDNSRLKGGMCYSKNDFIKKWGSELPASHQGIVCVEG